MPGRSVLTGNPAELGRHAGTGQQVGKIDVGLPGSKERVNFGQQIGNYVDQAGNAAPTTNGIIHYGKDSIHIVPSRPDP
ncbi:polymorphic toxin type 50 domain-containing protein [Lysobacter sp. 2RAF19]